MKGTFYICIDERVFIFKRIKNSGEELPMPSRGILHQDSHSDPDPTELNSSYTAISYCFAYASIRLRNMR